MAGLGVGSRSKTKMYKMMEKTNALAIGPSSANPMPSRSIWLDIKKSKIDDKEVTVGCMGGMSQEMYTSRDEFKKCVNQHIDKAFDEIG